MSKTGTARATRLVIVATKVAEAEELIAPFATMPEPDRAMLFQQVSANWLEFSVDSNESPPAINIKIWADDPTLVKDAVVDATAGFWLTFHTNLDAVLVTPLADQPCII